jgi:hypothetical protein
MNIQHSSFIFQDMQLDAETNHKGFNIHTFTGEHEQYSPGSG